MTKLGERLHHERHDDWEPYDRITIDLVERYKTSGLSGDEWRFNAHVQWWFKGVRVHSTTYHDMETAMQLVYSGWVMREEGPAFPMEVIKREEECCDQPGCADEPVARFKLKKHYLHGHELATFYGDSFRKFCKKHLRRGDCGLSDSDANYEPLDGMGPEKGTVPEGSPSALLMPDGALVYPEPPKEKA